MLWNSFVFLVAFAPFIVVVTFNYKRWRRRYGPNVNLLSYYLRYATARTETDDKTLIYMAKTVPCVIWVMLVTGLMWS